MTGRNLEDLYGIPIDMLRHQVRKWERHRKPIQADFDGHFPEAGDTEESCVRAVLNELPCVGAEGCIAANKPEKCVRIK